MAEFKNEKLQARPWHFSLDHFNSLLLVVFPFLLFTCLFGDLVVTATHSACFVRQVDTCLLAYVSMDYPQQRAWHRWSACKCLLREIKQPAIRQADLPICSAESRQLGRTWREMNVWRSLPRGITQAWWRRGMDALFSASTCAEVTEAYQMCAARTKDRELPCSIFFSTWQNGLMMLWGRFLWVMVLFVPKGQRSR